METAPLLTQSVPDTSIDVIGPIPPSETSILPSKTSIVSPQPAKKFPVSKKRKRSLSDVMTEISCVTDVKFDPLQVSHTPPQLRLSTDIDTGHTYVIFSLF